jgi:hypothetical protein
MVRWGLLVLMSLGLWGCLATLQESRVSAPSPNPFVVNQGTDDLVTPRLFGLGLDMSTP